MIVAGTPYDFIDEYRALSKADRAVLHGGVDAPAAFILTDKGSDNERFCKMLSEVQCTVPVILPQAYPRDRMTGWRLTPLGVATLPKLFEQAHGDAKPKTSSRSPDRCSGQA